MAADPTIVETDLAAFCGRTLLLWSPGVLLIALTGNLALPARTLAWTAGLLWLAGLCLWNVTRCGRVHCMFTGPFFLAMAAVTVLAGFGTVSFGAQTWNLLGAIIFVGAIVLMTVPEWIWGRYSNRAAPPN
jgi:hypothetical protein